MHRQCRQFDKDKEKIIVTSIGGISRAAGSTAARLRLPEEAEAVRQVDSDGTSLRALSGRRAGQAGAARSAGRPGLLPRQDIRNAQTPKLHERCGRAGCRETAGAHQFHGNFRAAGPMDDCGDEGRADSERKDSGADRGSHYRLLLDGYRVSERSARREAAGGYRQWASPRNLKPHEKLIGEGWNEREFW